MPYLPISDNSRAIPQALADQARAIDDLNSMTSGQISGKLAALRRRAEITSAHWETSNWRASGVVLSGSIVVPPGKTSLQVLAALTGFYNGGGGPRSDQAAFRISINGTQSRSLARVPDNMDTYHLLGQYSRVLTVTPGQPVTIQVVALAGSNPGTDTSMNWSALDIFAALSA